MNSSDLNSRKMQTPAPPSTIVVLVHGTWPYGVLHSLLSRFSLTRRWAKKSPKTWSNSDQPFREGLTQALHFDARILEFFWSGFNGPHARRTAAVELAEFIDRAAADGPASNATRVFVVAHSHGGNVAAEACKLTKRVPAGIACMSTPFITASPRLLSEAERILFRYAGRIALNIALLLAVLFCLGWMNGFLKPFSVSIESWGYDSFDVGILAWFIAWTGTTMGAWFMMNRYVTAKFGVRESFGKWLTGWRDWCSMRTPSVPCLTIRASGDEAFAALMLGQIANSVERVLSKALSGLTRNYLARWWSDLPYWVYFGLTVLWFYGATQSQTIKEALDEINLLLIAVLDSSSQGWVLLMLQTLPLAFFSAIVLFRISAAFLVVLISSLLGAVAVFPFGLGSFLLLPWMELHVEPALPDQKTEVLFLSKKTVDESQLRFRHAIYTIPESWISVGSWISKLSVEADALSKPKRLRAD